MQLAIFNDVDAVVCNASAIAVTRVTPAAALKLQRSGV